MILKFVVTQTNFAEIKMILKSVTFRYVT